MIDQTGLALAPLERLVFPPALDGRAGINRAPADAIKQIAAETDLEAVQAWLAEFHDSPNTFRNYRKEVERLLLWSFQELGKPLSALMREDLARYEAFLEDPQPAMSGAARASLATTPPGGRSRAHSPQPAAARCW